MTVLPIILTSTGLTAASSPSPAAAPAGAYISADFCNTLCKLTCDVKMGTSCSNAETVQNEYLEACGQDCTNLVRLNNTGDLVVDGDIRGQNVGGTNSVFTGGLNYDTATLTLNNSGIVAAKGVEVTDGSYSLRLSKGQGFTNFTLKSSATSDTDTDLVLGNKDSTLNLLGNLNLVKDKDPSASAPSGELTVAGNITSKGIITGQTVNAEQDIVATRSVRSTATLFVGPEINNVTPNKWDPKTNGGTLVAGVLQISSKSDQAIQCKNGGYPCGKPTIL